MEEGEIAKVNKNKVVQRPLSFDYFSFFLSEFDFRSVTTNCHKLFCHSPSERICSRPTKCWHTSSVSVHSLYMCMRAVVLVDVPHLLMHTTNLLECQRRLLSSFSLLLCGCPFLSPFDVEEKKKKVFTSIMCFKFELAGWINWMDKDMQDIKDFVDSIFK